MPDRHAHKTADDDPPPSVEAMVWQHEAKLGDITRRLDRIEHQLWLVLLGVMAVLGSIIAQIVRG